MTQTTAEGVEALRAATTRSVFVPTDASYNDARRARNADIDRYPAVVARGRLPQDAVAATALAREYELEISVRWARAR